SLLLPFSLRAVFLVVLVLRYRHPFLCFFFQAEDGIRDLIVTGVQTCALPIYAVHWAAEAERLGAGEVLLNSMRSEERREGKSVDLGGRRIIKKKKKVKMESGGGTGVNRQRFHCHRTKLHCY